MRLRDILRRVPLLSPGLDDGGHIGLREVQLFGHAVVENDGEGAGHRGVCVRRRGRAGVDDEVPLFGAGLGLWAPRRDGGGRLPDGVVLRGIERDIHGGVRVVDRVARRGGQLVGRAVHHGGRMQSRILTWMLPWGLLEIFSTMCQA